MANFSLKSGEYCVGEKVFVMAHHHFLKTFYKLFLMPVKFSDFLNDESHIYLQYGLTALFAHFMLFL